MAFLRVWYMVPLFSLFIYYRLCLFFLNILIFIIISMRMISNSSPKTQIRIISFFLLSLTALMTSLTRSPVIHFPSMLKKTNSIILSRPSSQFSLYYSIFMTIYLSFTVTTHIITLTNNLNFIFYWRNFPY